MNYLKGLVKQVDGSGAFTAVASVPSLDRDGEIVDPGAFVPLPPSIPVHAFHSFSDPVGRAVPRYDGDTLLVDGTFGNTTRAQEIRQLVVDGVLGHVSVGFMNSQKKTDEEGITHVTGAELLEVSLVSIPANREAAVLAAKAGRRNSAADQVIVDSIHGDSVALGANCPGAPGYEAEGRTVSEARRMAYKATQALLAVELAEIKATLAGLGPAPASVDVADWRATLAELEGFLRSLEQGG